jgi:hypothetical protein
MRKFAFLSLGFLAAALFLSACGASRRGGGSETFYDRYAKDNGKSALIFIGGTNNIGEIDSKVFGLRYNFIVGSYYTFRNEKGKTYTFGFYPGKTNGYLIEPGTYKLIDQYLYGLQGNSYFNVPLDGLYSAEFTVAAGEKVYLGYIDTQVDITRHYRGNFIEAITFRWGPMYRYDFRADITVENRLGTFTDLYEGSNLTDRDLTVRLIQFNRLKDVVRKTTYHNYRLLEDKRKQTGETSAPSASQNPAATAVDVPVEADRVQ